MKEWGRKLSSRRFVVGYIRQAWKTVAVCNWKWAPFLLGLLTSHFCLLSLCRSLLRERQQNEEWRRYLNAKAPRTQQVSMEKRREEILVDKITCAQNLLKSESVELTDHCVSATLTHTQNNKMTELLFLELERHKFADDLWKMMSQICRKNTVDLLLLIFIELKFLHYKNSLQQLKNYTVSLNLVLAFLLFMMILKLY